MNTKKRQGQRETLRGKKKRIVYNQGKLKRESGGDCEGELRLN